MLLGRLMIQNFYERILTSVTTPGVYQHQQHSKNKTKHKAMHAFICYMGKTKTRITEIIDPLKHKQDQGQIVSKEQNITELKDFIWRVPPI